MLFLKNYEMILSYFFFLILYISLVNYFKIEIKPSWIMNSDYWLKIWIQLFIFIDSLIKIRPDRH